MLADMTAAGTSTLSLARQSLEQALEAHARARRIEEQAMVVMQAATAAIEQARAEVADFADLDEDLARSRLAALKGDPNAKKPDEIREARRKRLIAREELEAAEQTLQAAQAELGQAHENTEHARKVCASNATSVISESASVLIQDWHRVNLERENLRMTLRSLVVAGVPLDYYRGSERSRIIQDFVSAAGLPFGYSLDWDHLQRKIGEVLTFNYESQDPAQEINRARAYWKQFADAIMANPQAELPPLPDLKGSPI